MDQLEADLRSATNASWNTFLAIVDPMRPDLFRYCRRLTGNVWDAEDLIQDTLEQAFARLATLTDDVANPQAYVLRIASNLWISRIRRARVHDAAGKLIAPAQAAEQTASGEAGAPGSADTLLRVREAADRMMSSLAPQERASVLLKEVFDLTLDEIAGVLGTSVGAVKAALHRGRSRLDTRDDAPAPRQKVDGTVLEQFVDRFNARDRTGLLALMLDTASIRMPGVDEEIGREAFSREPGWLYYNLLNPTSHWEVATFLNEPIVLVLNRKGGEVGSVMRLETVDHRVAAIRVYAFCPDTVREVAAGLGLVAAPMGLYRFKPEILRPPR